MKDIAENRWSLVLTWAIVAAAIAAAPVVATAQDAQPSDPALDQYYNANALYNRKLFKLAVDEYEKFLQAYPQHAKAGMARYGLGLSYYFMKDWAKAAGLLDQSMQDAAVPDKDAVSNKLGSAYLALDKNELAEKAFTYSAGNAKDENRKIEGLVGLTESRFRQEKWDLTIAAADQFMAVGAKSSFAPHVQFLGAIARFRTAKYEEAAKVFAAIVADQAPSSYKHPATYLLAECKREAGALEESIPLYTQAAVKDSGAYAEEAHYRLGYVCFMLKKYDQSIAQFTTFLAAYPKSTQAPKASLYLGRSQFEAKQFPQAVATLTPLTTLPDVGPDATLWLAKSNAAQKQFAQIETALTAAMPALKASPLAAELYFELGDAQRELAKYKEGAASFALAVTAGGDKPLAAVALYLQAFCLHKAADYPTSLALCQAYLAKYPKGAQAEDAAFLQAENLMLTAKIDEALAAYGAYLGAYPKGQYLATAQMRTGEGLYQKQDWAKMLAAVEPLAAAAVKEEGIFSRLWFIIGEGHFRLKADAKAVEAYQKFIAGHAQHDNADAALFNQAMAYKNLAQDDQSAASLNKLLAGYPKSKLLIEAGVALGRIHYIAKRYDQARAALTAPAAAGDADGQYLMGWVALAEKKDDEALASFNALLAKNPQHALSFDAALQVAAIQVRKEQFAQAQQSLTALIGAQPKHEKIDQAVFYLGRCMWQLKQFDGAAQQFTRVLTEFPKSTVADQAMYGLAWCQKDLKQAPAAMATYEKFLTAYPTSAWAQDVALELAELEFEAKAYDKAVTRLTALAKEPRKDLVSKIYYRLGWCYYNTEEMAKAAQSFETALKETTIEPTAKAIALYQAGESALKLKEFERANGHFAAAVALNNPKIDEPALLRLGECQALVNQWAPSQQSYTQFLAKYPKSDLTLQALFGQAWAMENQKLYPQAIETYRKVVAAGRRDATSARSQFQIGECLLAGNQLDEAIKELTLVDVKYGLPQWSSKAILEMGRILKMQKKDDQAAERFQEVVTKFADTDAATVAKKMLEGKPQ
ncbi:MAG: tetratricopeptide repeat protein [Planctomycetaceae bacterium]|nr:tetratricopeptide repeat protein [Planctomycetaceae bacterium]